MMLRKLSDFTSCNLLADTRLRGRSRLGAAKARNLTPETLNSIVFCKLVGRHNTIS